MRTFIVSIYLVKAAERDVIRRTARNLLRGLPFAVVYTPHFAMCTDSLSEILIATGSDPVETRSVMRFSCSGLFPKAEMKAVRARMDDRCLHHPETVRLWHENEAGYFEAAAAKANLSLQKTFKEISRKGGGFFNVMIINNDLLPLLELIASKEYNHLDIARPGNVIQFRYQVAIGGRGVMSWQLVHAYNLK
jgi:hypothetical protein